MQNKLFKWRVRGSDSAAGTASCQAPQIVRCVRAGAALVGAIGSLSEEQREVFVMREYAGMPFKEIASVVGASENTVKSRMRYALEHMRNYLQKAGLAPAGSDGGS